MGLSALELEEFRKVHGYPIWALVSPRSAVSGSAVAWEPEGCGAVILPFVKTLREARDALQPKTPASLDLMVEVDHQGSILSRWDVPRSSSLRGVRGGDLLVAAPLHPICDTPSSGPASLRESILAIRPTGEFRVFEVQPRQPRLVSEACIVTTPYDPRFEAECWTLTDPTSGRSRRIARISTCH